MVTLYFNVNLLGRSIEKKRFGANYKENEVRCTHNVKFVNRQMSNAAN